MVASRSFVIGLLKKKFFRHGYRKYEFPPRRGTWPLVKAAKVYALAALDLCGS